MSWAFEIDTRYSCITCPSSHKFSLSIYQIRQRQNCRRLRASRYTKPIVDRPVIDKSNDQGLEYGTFISRGGGKASTQEAANQGIESGDAEPLWDWLPKRSTGRLNQLLAKRIAVI